MSHSEESRIPRLLETAPDFSAQSTEGVTRLSDYTAQGRYVLLFSHPADFSPVCSTEFIALASAWQRFEDMGVQLIGVSVDSINSHIAWIRDLEKNAGIEIKFPLVADSDQLVCNLYGLIHPAASKTSPVRAVFAIDPNRVFRAIFYYSPQMGRSVDELIRVFQGLQAIDRKHVNLPVDWKPGQDVVVAAPSTLSDAAKRANSESAGLKVETWYLTRKPLEADELLESSPALHFVTGVSSLAVAPREERHIEETAEYKLNLQL